MKAEANGNLVSDLTMPNRSLSSYSQKQYNAIRQRDISCLITLIETKNRAFIKGSVF